MRAICEQCDQVQPIDWQPGDLCTDCGAAVRRDVRCYWCAEWTPFANYCRGCGAAVVDEELYGAARMLKDAGTDRFHIVKQLDELDPEQIDNFSRIYQRHAIAMARHVDDLRFVQQFTRQRHWSGELEDELIGQLPWPTETLATFAGKVDAVPLAGGDLTRLAAIRTASPIPTTQQLATIAMLRLGDEAVATEVWSLLTSPSETIAAEAALLLGSWRVRFSNHARDPQGLVRVLTELLQHPALGPLAGLRLMGLGKPKALPPEFDPRAWAPNDPDETLELALATIDTDRLISALDGEVPQCMAAAVTLARHGIAAPLAGVIAQGPDEVRAAILYDLARAQKPFPELRDPLLNFVEATEDEASRERASRILCQDLLPADAIRVARASAGDRSIFQSLLKAELPTEARIEVLDHMIGCGAFAMSQYGLEELAVTGEVSHDFVASRFATANPATRNELLRFAETRLAKLQPGAADEAALHEFLLRVVFEPGVVEQRARAWDCLHRVYRKRGDLRGHGPVRIEAGAMKLVEPVATFVDNLATMLRTREVLDELTLAERLAYLLESAEPSGIELLLEHEQAAHRLVSAVLEMLPLDDLRANLLDAGLVFLGKIGTHPLWYEEVVTGVRSLGKTGNYYYDRTLELLTT